MPEEWRVVSIVAGGVEEGGVCDVGTLTFGEGVLMLILLGSWWWQFGVMRRGVVGVVWCDVAECFCW